MRPVATTTGATRRRAAKGGFTLLELIVAVTILASFVLPILEVLAQSRGRAIRYTQLRQVRDLAQQKLHDRIHFIVEEDEGTFEEEGRPKWNWIVHPPELRSQGEQVLLEYTISVEVPFKLPGGAESEFGGSTYEYTAWTFPSELWYEEQDLLYDAGQPSLLWGDPALDGEVGLPGGTTGGSFR